MTKLQTVYRFLFKPIVESDEYTADANRRVASAYMTTMILLLNTELILGFFLLDRKSFELVCVAAYLPHFIASCVVIYYKRKFGLFKQIREMSNKTQQSRRKGLLSFGLSAIFVGPCMVYYLNKMSGDLGYAIVGGISMSASVFLALYWAYMRRIKAKDEPL
jgi:hypothetical protein